MWLWGLLQVRLPGIGQAGPALNVEAAKQGLGWSVFLPSARKVERSLGPRVSLLAFPVQGMLRGVLLEGGGLTLTA
jgi:hypothetical protein